MYNCIDRYGNIVNNVWLSYKERNEINDDTKIGRDVFVHIGKRIKCVKKCVKDYLVDKAITQYNCTKGNDTFSVKYEPIAIYGKRYVLCMDKKNIVMFDRMNKKYQKIGSIYNIKFDDNFIYDINANKVYFVYDNQIIDITKYFLEHLANEKEVNIVSGISVISKDDFFYHTEDEIRELVRLERERDKEDQEKIKLQELKEKAEKEKKKREIAQKEALRQLKKSLEELRNFETKPSSFERIIVSDLFIEVGDHKEINPLYLIPGVLKYIDLSKESFKNVKISGIDFRECNIWLYPQDVYQKDLSGCNFEGMFVDPFMNFNNVDIRGARFSDDNNPKTIDRMNSFANSIYDENTTYNGVSFSVIYQNNKKKHGSQRSF